MKKRCTSCARLFPPTAGDRHKTCSTCRKHRRRCACGTLCLKTSRTCRKCSTQTREANGNWRGGKTYHKAGYVMCRVPDRGYVFEHVLVMEEKLGRRLRPGENVHHRNGVKTDNRRRNLELWIRAQPSGQRVRDAVRWAREILKRYGEGRF